MEGLKNETCLLYWEGSEAEDSRTKKLNYGEGTKIGKNLVGRKEKGGAGCEINKKKGEYTGGKGVNEQHWKLGW